MEISSYEAWEEEERQDQQRLAVTHPNSVQNYVDHQRVLDNQRAELLVLFPYTVVATGLYAEHDYACRWCWQNISPANGSCIDCHSDYPSCPLVLATDYIERGAGKDETGENVPWERKRYTNPGDHSHEGQWSFLWLGKTDYDYGYGEYCFGNESDRDNFLAAFSTFTWSEEWDKEGG